MERFFAFAFRSSAPVEDLRKWGEQTAYALLVSRNEEQFYRLPRCYQISQGSAEPSAVAGHFVNDGSRDLMYLAGVKRLNQERFLSAI